MSRVHYLFGYCGGKTRLAKSIFQFAPKSFYGYMEPFVGGGSVFSVFVKHVKGPIILNDKNKDAMRTYKAVKENVYKVMEILSTMKASKSLFLQLRNSPPSEDDFEAAARFIYLVNYSYGSLWSMKRDGSLNMTYKYHTNTVSPKILPDVPNMMFFSQWLQNVTLESDDFEIIIRKYVQPNMLVYCDPPYIPVFKERKYLYTAEPFTIEDHIRLRDLINELTQMGVYVMLSNSYNEKVFELYKDYYINPLVTKRTVKKIELGQSHFDIQEVLVTNYKPELPSVNIL